MNEFSPRMKQILQVLLEQNKEISVKNLAEQVGVSKRTVQRELGYVDRQETTRPGRNLPRRLQKAEITMPETGRSGAGA